MNSLSHTIMHTSPISGVSATTQYVATAGYDNRVILWSVPAHAPLVSGTHDHLANQCRFSRSGELLVTSSSDYTSRIWKVPEMQLQAILTGHDDDVEMSCFSPDDAHVATASRDGKVRIFKVSDGTLTCVMHGHTADVISVEWSADCKRVVSSSDDGTVRIWDALSGDEIAQIDMGEVETDTVVIRTDGQILSGSDDGDIGITLPDGQSHTTPAHDAGIKRLILSPDETRLVSASYDKTIAVWDISSANTPTLIQRAAAPNDIWLRSAAFIDTDTLAFGTFGSTYATYTISKNSWDTSFVEPTGGVNAVKPLNGATYTVGDSGMIRRDGKAIQELGSCCNFLVEFDGLLYTGGQEGVLFNALTGERIYQHKSPLNCAAVIDDRVVVGTYTGEVLVFREGSLAGQEIEYETTIEVHANAIKGIATSSDLIFTVDATGSAAATKSLNWLVAQRYPHSHSMIADGTAHIENNMFATVSRDRKLRVFDLTTGVIDAISTPHENSHKCVHASGDLIAIGGYRGRVSVYDRSTGAWVYNRRLTMSGISSISSDASQSLYASSYDGNVYVIRKNELTNDTGQL